MPQPKLRVLLDLSMAARGYCGIAQDVRLLYKILASSPEVEVTGLVYHPRRFGPLHRFLGPEAPRGDRLANQARFLWTLSEGTIVWPNFAPFRALKQLRHLVPTVAARSVQVDRLDADLLGEALWRVLFSQTLSPNDRSLVQNSNFLLSNLCDGMIYARALLNRCPLRLDTRGYDFLIVQGPRPFRTSPETRQIVRYHDMIPLSQPDTMRNPLVIDWRHRAIRQCDKSAFFVCNTEPMRHELTTAYPEARDRSTTIPYLLGDMYFPDPQPKMVARIMSRRRSVAAGAPPASVFEDCPRYVMCVSTLEPRKNFLGLMQAFDILKSRARIEGRTRDLKLLIVGSPGWKYKPILSGMRALAERGELFHLEQVSADELRVLYSHAEAFVFASHSEGFGFPPLEAMQCDTPVIASDIPAHRCVLGDAALYCDSYDPNSIAAAIERLVERDDSMALRAELIARGRQRVRLYGLDRCSQQWSGLLDRLRAEGSRTGHSSTAQRAYRGAAEKAA